MRRLLHIEAVICDKDKAPEEALGRLQMTGVCIDSACPHYHGVTYAVPPGGVGKRAYTLCDLEVS